MLCTHVASVSVEFVRQKLEGTIVQVRIMKCALRLVVRTSTFIHEK